MLFTTKYRSRAEKIKAQKIMRNTYQWLAIYGIFLTSIFFVRSFAMFMEHKSLIVETTAHAEELPQVKPTIMVPTATPTSSFDKRAYILSKSHGDILIRIWTNESSRGNSDGLAGYCREKGQSNEFGYSPRTHYCFSSFTYSVDVINDWFERHLKNNSLGDCLTIYSGNENGYIQKFLAQSNN